MRKNKAKKTTECIVQMHCIFQVFKARFCDHTVLPYMRNQRSLNPPKIRSFPVPETLPERRGAIAFLATAPFFVFPFFFLLFLMWGKPVEYVNDYTEVDANGHILRVNGKPFSVYLAVSFLLSIQDRRKMERISVTLPSQTKSSIFGI